jgi:hypothetical protein
MNTQPFYISTSEVSLFEKSLDDLKCTEEEIVAKVEETLKSQPDEDLEKTLKICKKVTSMKKAAEKGFVIEIRGVYNALKSLIEEGAKSGFLEIQCGDETTYLKKAISINEKNYPNTIIVTSMPLPNSKTGQAYAFVHSNDQAFMCCKKSEIEVFKANMEYMIKPQENNSNNQQQQEEDDEVIEIMDEDPKPAEVEQVSNATEESEIEPAKEEQDEMQVEIEVQPISKPVPKKETAKKAQKEQKIEDEVQPTKSEVAKANAGEVKIAPKKPAAVKKPKKEADTEVEEEEEEKPEQNGFKVGQVVKVTVAKFSKKPRFAMIDGEFTKARCRCWVFIQNENEWTGKWAPQAATANVNYDQIETVSDKEAQTALNNYKSWREENENKPFNDEVEDGKTLFFEEDLPKYWSTHEMFEFEPMDKPEKAKTTKKVIAKPQVSAKPAQATAKVTGKRKQVEEVAPVKSKKTKTEFDEFMEKLAKIPMKDATTVMQVMKLVMPNHFQ